MKFTLGIGCAVVAAGVFLAALMPAVAQDASGLVPFGATLVKPIERIPGGTVVLPTSSLPKPAGQARTHLQFVIPDTPFTPPFNCNVSPTCETPASLACVYLLVTQSHGCDPDIVTALSTHGSKVIAIVDAFHNKSALADLQAFSSTFGLPAPHLEILKCTASSCSTSHPAPPACRNSDQCGWAIEESLDLQAAHAMAPHAKLILVEALSDSNADLFVAESAAIAAVAAAGGGEVSNSWGGPDFFGETGDDSIFANSKVAVFASTGDHKNNNDPPWSADVEYPSTSPNVVAVGGTTIIRNSNHTFEQENSWDNSDGGTGGGLSVNESRPGFQNGIANKVSTHRGVPDIAADADPKSGLVIRLSSTCCKVTTGYYPVGGTSLASPLVAAMTNGAGHFRTSIGTSSTSQQNTIYGELGVSSKINDIKTGTCHNGGNPTDGSEVSATVGWDVCTGVGTPHGLSGL